MSLWMSHTLVRSLGVNIGKKKTVQKTVNFYLCTQCTLIQAMIWKEQQLGTLHKRLILNFDITYFIKFLSFILVNNNREKTVQNHPRRRKVSNHLLISKFNFYLCIYTAYINSGHDMKRTKARNLAWEADFKLWYYIFY